MQYNEGREATRSVSMKAANGILKAWESSISKPDIHIISGTIGMTGARGIPDTFFHCKKK